MKTETQMKDEMAPFLQTGHFLEDEDGSVWRWPANETSQAPLLVLIVDDKIDFIKTTLTKHPADLDLDFVCHAAHEASIHPSVLFVVLCGFDESDLRFAYKHWREFFLQERVCVLLDAMAPGGDATDARFAGRDAAHYLFGGEPRISASTYGAIMSKRSDAYLRERIGIQTTVQKTMDSAEGDYSYAFSAFRESVRTWLDKVALPHMRPTRAYTGADELAALAKACRDFHNIKAAGNCHDIEDCVENAGDALRAIADYPDIAARAGAYCSALEQSGNFHSSFCRGLFGVLEDTDEGSAKRIFSLTKALARHTLEKPRRYVPPYWMELLFNDGEKAGVFLNGFLCNEGVHLSTFLYCCWLMTQRLGRVRSARFSNQRIVVPIEVEADKNGQPGLDELKDHLLRLRKDSSEEGGGQTIDMFRQLVRAGAKIEETIDVNDGVLRLTIHFELRAIGGGDLWR